MRPMNFGQSLLFATVTGLAAAFLGSPVICFVVPLLFILLGDDDEGGAK